MHVYIILYVSTAINRGGTWAATGGWVTVVTVVGWCVCVCVCDSESAHYRLQAGVYKY